METSLETKTAAVAKVPSGATVVLYGAVVEGDPTEAQIETGRNALTATLEIVGASNVSSYLTRLLDARLADGETLRYVVEASTVKTAPDPIPDAAEPETLDDAAASTETAAEPETSEA